MSDQTISEALEEVTAECSRLREELSDANDKKNYWETSYRWSKEDVARLEARVVELEKLAARGVDALVWTAEYAMLPGIPGWSWYDWIVIAKTYGIDGVRTNEKQIKWLENSGVNRGHHIADELIDIAWKRRSFYYDKVEEGIDDILDALNIFRCEWCSGEGRIEVRLEPKSLELHTCPDCNGKGYTMGVSDE